MIEIRILSRELSPALTVFFEHLAADPASARFHPHPFTPQEAAKRCEYEGRDIYCVLLKDGAVAAYGMLRGWDEGYAIPSLGIAVDRTYRGCGFGELMMHYLHAAARDRGAEKILLKVHPDNTRAAALYRKLGYQFQSEMVHEQLVGFLTLCSHHG